ncbi:hypothetical protein HK405_006547 [Cladochytrium tenue]|nr:hypothetical protein HK405_006547 [Cladochytrium tenue]
MRTSIFAAIFSALLAIGSAVASPLERRDLDGFTICSAAGDAITPKAISYTSVVPGKNVTVTLTGDLSTVVTAGASAHITAVWLGFITVLDVTVDMCADVTCPVQPGTDITISFSFLIPAEAPSGVTVDVTAHGYNGDGTELVCVENANFVVQ